MLCLSAAASLSVWLSLSLFFRLPLHPSLLQAAWGTAESRLRFISDFLNAFLPVPLPACKPVCPPACLDIGFALWLWPYTRRATGASATAGPSVLSCRVVSSCHRGPSLPPPHHHTHTHTDTHTHTHTHNQTLQITPPPHSSTMCTYWIPLFTTHSDKGICQADEQSELKRCVMHAWKDLTSCRGQEDAGWGIRASRRTRTSGEDYHHHGCSSHQVCARRRAHTNICLLSMRMASTQLRVFSSNNIDICIINPRIPVVETGANSHATSLPSTSSPLSLSLFLALVSHPPFSLFDAIQQERAGGKGGDFMSCWNCPGPARKKKKKEREHNSFATDWSNN